MTNGVGVKGSFEFPSAQIKPMPELESEARTISLLRRVLDPRILHLIVLPTEQCNFRCTYCYEDFALGAMPPAVRRGLRALIAKRVEDTEVLKLDWFGGEPLLALETVVDVSSFALRTFESRDRKFVGSMTTNAYRLSIQVFERLLAAGVSHYQISLDGSRERHDVSRVRRDGGRTFDRIWANLCEIAAFARRCPNKAFDITLRLHYDRDSAYFLVDLLDAIAAELIVPADRIVVNFHEIEPLGSANDSVIRFPTEREHAFVRDLASHPLFADGRVSHVVAVDMKDYICYAAKGNSFVVRSDGRLGKCTVALSDDRNVVGRLQEDGTVAVNNDLLRPWLRGVFTEDLNALACPLVGLPPVG